MSDKAQQAHTILANLSTLIPDLESVYKDIHSHSQGSGLRGLDSYRSD